MNRLSYVALVTGTTLGMVFVACAINPQPIPPNEATAAGFDAGVATGGKGSGTSSDGTGQFPAPTSGENGGAADSGGSVPQTPSGDAGAATSDAADGAVDSGGDARPDAPTDG